MAKSSATAPSKNFFVGIIDGTGPEGADYDRVMKPGFCRQFAKTFDANSKYVRGPTASGSGLSKAVAEITKACKDQRAKDPTSDIVLIGYSRGAVGCLMVADQLRRETDIDVHTMVLLDPVDRHASSPYKLVPNNVRASFRAYRELSARLILKYEGTIPTVSKGAADSTWARFKNLLTPVANLLAPSNPFRPSFSSAALGVARGGHFDATDPDQHRRVSYPGSHGALGGVGYEWVTEDGPCQKALINDLQAWLKSRLDAKITLVPGYDPDLTKPAIKGIVQAAVATLGAGYDGAMMGAKGFDSLSFMAVEKIDELANAARELVGVR